MVSASASEPVDREFYPGLCSYSVLAMSLQFKLAASSSHGDFEACVNLFHTCTPVVSNLLQACRFSVQVCCKLKLLSGSDSQPDCTEDPPCMWACCMLTK
ncbi:hypothetical protein AVEN_10619-1 [Araneus ventricosus]|uniref:Uncharacterized protein n=1 Tax=Araneus ventricosus TaxID=182803 RepID=A0A4Y2PRA5_ARAVE|nr:hypothetical protein AVEN_195019-1 [Araneus ventricosus]GBN52977.1 hypothetical protein AVEN_191752-1 [Araneus ventricosus]GBN53642.1 hypothetical protein AVEN_266855-1 [Araneus ventricosus]GBN53684.1 hypothetical protein AVEN_10619-1 [Araneus ventricosus]